MTQTWCEGCQTHVADAVAHYDDYRHRAGYEHGPMGALLADQEGVTKVRGLHRRDFTSLDGGYLCCSHCLRPDEYPENWPCETIKCLPPDPDEKPGAT